MEKDNNVKMVESCCICMEDLLPDSLPFSLDCNHILCYMCAHDLIRTNNILCPLCRSPIDKNKIKYPKIDEKAIEGLPCPEWSYKTRRSNEYWFFTPKDAKEVEKGYETWKKGGSSTYSFQIKGITITIDYVNMLQTSSNGTIREIKRVKDSEEDIPITGIAGLRLA